MIFSVGLPTELSILITPDKPGGLFRIKNVSSISGLGRDVMLIIDDVIFIGEDELTEQYISASTAGGQHANKNATGVRLLFDLNKTRALPAGVKRRLMEQAAGNISKDGVLAITSQRFRERERNRADVREKLCALISKARVKKKFRVATRPGKAAHQRRLDTKSKRSSTKKLRRKVREDD